MPPAENSYSEQILNVDSIVIPPAKPMQEEKEESKNSFEENKIQIMREDVRHGAIAFENMNDPYRKETVIQRMSDDKYHEIDQIASSLEPDHAIRTTQMDADQIFFETNEEFMNEFQRAGIPYTDRFGIFKEKEEPNNNRFSSDIEDNNNKRMHSTTGMTKLPRLSKKKIREKVNKVKMDFEISHLRY